MISDINIQSSKEENKLVFKMGLFNRIFGFVFNIAMILAFPLITLSYTLQHLDTLKEDIFGEIMSSLVALGFAILMYVWVNNPTRLIKITGSDKEENKQIAQKTLYEMDWIIQHEKADYLIAEPKSYYQKQLTVIFDRNDILVSSLRFGRSEAIMTYHADSADSFKQKFQAYINASTKTKHH